MPKKKDPSVTFLNRFGYNVVKLPRAGIEPMDVIGSEDTQAFLIVEVLKSDAITVSASDEHGQEVALDVPAIQQLVGANVKVKPSGSSSGAITYAGPAPVTFGFIVDEIDFDGTRWSLQGAVPSGGLAFGAGGPPVADTSSPILLGAGCRGRI